MNALAYEFTVAQRRVLDRYTRLLGSLPVTFRNIPLVFERRRSQGHQLAVLARDSRLENAPFNERYLQELGVRAEALRLLCASHVENLETFSRESLEITRQTSRSEPLSQVDFRRFSLSRSSTWMLFPPTDIPDLLHELALRYYFLSTEIRQLKYTVVEVHNESFGLKAVFANAMDHRSCNCHTTPAVAQELFAAAATVPAWDIHYSSQEPAVRAGEYKADIAALFNEFVSVNSQMGLFIEELHQRVNGASNELLQAKSARTLGDLNFKLAPVTEGASECMAMLDHFQAWLRK
ncbi:hypothetical protein ACIOUG_21450 [Pseudomonas sp. NPDC087803]|uniref:hypothetical protein n=1 Tax=Pseudomonas sp. NPDC087803 TaxID=3364448 RepID=UPI0037FA70FD